MSLLSVPLCVVAASCATDRVEPGDDTSMVNEEVVTVVDKCAVDHAPNANFDVESDQNVWTRSASTIDDAGGASNCDCLNWERYKNNHGGDEAAADLAYAKCRPDTFVDIKWEVWFPIMVYEIEVPSWTLSNGATECSNSTVTWEEWKQTGTNTWVLELAQQTRHPSMGSDGVCRLVPIIGGGESDGWKRRLHVRATRGLDQSNLNGQTPISHGYEGVRVSAWVENE